MLKLRILNELVRLASFRNELMRLLVISGGFPQYIHTKVPLKNI